MGFLSNDNEGPGIDFDDLYGAWEEVAIRQAALDRYERALEELQAMCKKQAYEEDVKRPPMEYLKQVVHYVGNRPEDKEVIDQLTEEIIRARELLTKAKGRLDAMQNTVRVWQTMSANARKAVIVE
jgi:hypothetical protein